ncbi:acyltransferase [bacterium]|nr:acyltransferase [bacterium]MBU1990831.1 acyltransferase [bacterium]
MTLNKLLFKIRERAVEILIQKSRVLFYSLLSNIPLKAKKYQPVLSNGEGTIKIGKNVSFGVSYAPDYYSRYCYLNARREQSYIEIGDNCWINNNAAIISDGKKIIIGKNCLIGTNFQAIDSDFHDLNPENRFGGKNIIKKDVIIEDNVFIGNDVTILKGVVVGENSVIGNHSVLTKSIPKNTVAAGNPAVVIRKI